MVSRELVEVYTDVLTSLPGDHIDLFARSLGEAQFVAMAGGGLPDSDDTERFLREKWDELAAFLPSYELVDREGYIREFAVGLHVLDESLPSFRLVREIRDSIPQILGGEVRSVLDIDQSLGPRDLTVGAQVLTAAIIDLSGPDLTNPVRDLLGPRILMEFGDDSLAKRNIEVRHVISAVAKALKATKRHSADLGYPQPPSTGVGFDPRGQLT